MDRRTKILVGGFGALVGYGFISGVVYPTWIAPLLSLEERIATKQEELNKLEALDARVTHARHEYKAFAERVGAMELTRVENTLRGQLNDLIAKHRLEDANVAPSRGTVDRRTGLERMTLSVNAAGTLESAVRFLQELAELPQLIRVGNVSLSPSSSSRQNKRADRVNLRVPVEVLVLPQQKILGVRLEASRFAPPPTVVRHTGRDYSDIWERTPFIEFEPLKPLMVDAGRDLQVEVGRLAQVTIKASGGDSNFTYEIEPREHVKKIEGPSVLFDTATPFEQLYTITVRDGAESQPATDQLRVDVRPPQIVEKPPPPPPPPPPVERGPQRDPQGRTKQVVMALIRSDPLSRRGELMVENSATQERTYHAVGDDFDGGTLKYVHPRGGIVHRNNEYFVYPIGGKLVEDVRAEEAVTFPQLQDVISRLRAADEAEKAEAANKAGAAVETPPSEPVSATMGRAGDEVPPELLKAPEEEVIVRPVAGGQTPADSPVAGPAAEPESTPSAKAPAQAPPPAGTSGAEPSQKSAPAKRPSPPQGDTASEDDNQKKKMPPRRPAPRRSTRRPPRP